MDGRENMLTSSIKEFFKTWWPGVILTTIGVGIALFQAISTYYDDQKQMQIQVMELESEALNLLGMKPIGDDTVRWIRNSGKFEVTEEDRERLEKVRKIIQKIEIISGSTENLDVLKMQYLFQSGDFDQFEEVVYEKVGTDKPGEAMIMLAMIYQSIEGLEDKAFSYMEKALEANPKNVWLKLKYGLILHAHMKNDKSIEVLTSILSEQPFQDDAVQILAHVYLESGRMEKAKMLLAEYHASGKETFNSHYTLGGIFLYEKDPNRAVSEYREGLRLYQESVLIHNALSIVYSDLGQTELSEKHKTLSELYSNITHGEDKHTTYYDLDKKSKIDTYFEQLFLDSAQH